MASVAYNVSERNGFFDHGHSCVTGASAHDNTDQVCWCDTKSTDRRYRRNIALWDAGPGFERTARYHRATSLALSTALPCVLVRDACQWVTRSLTLAHEKAERRSQMSGNEEPGVFGCADHHDCKAQGHNTREENEARASDQGTRRKQHPCLSFGSEDCGCAPMHVRIYRHRKVVAARNFIRFLAWWFQVLGVSSSMPCGWDAVRP